MIFFASASANQNDIVEKEVLKAGGTELHVTASGIEFEADLETAYRFAMWTRSSTRLLVLVHRYDNINSTDELYEHSLSLPWENWINPDTTFAITQTVSDCRWITNSHFAALRFKDAVVERIREAFDGNRPDVDKDNPDIVFHLHVNRKLVSWYVDFAGRDIAKRGYRVAQTEAVMNEFMAASVLARSQWNRMLDDNPVTLLDPFCGSGIICIEAALMATNTAPGLLNPDKFAFSRLPIHKQEVWDRIVDEAENAKRKCKCRIIGWDIDSNAIGISKKNAEAAGVSELIEFSVHDFSETTEDDVELLNLSGTQEIKGCIVTDPPYGVRLELSESALRHLYSAIGSVAFNCFGGWHMAILCTNQELLGYIEMKPDRTNILINGGLDCQVAHYYIFSNEQRAQMLKRAKAKREARLAEPLSEGAQMAANRLQKNLASIGKEMKKQGVSCYRLYDADMPEYSAAIDVYENKWINLAEYAAPPSINEEDAKRRLEELVLATERVTGIPLEDIHVKRREIQKGSAQYVKKGTPSASHFFIANENGHRFSVNFQDYLDTGIFLDHRPVRKYIEEHSKNKRFLNLFCYTATATVYAAAGGALSTVSVDANANYLDWSIKNMALNGFRQMNHFYYRNDCLSYLRENHDIFDLIFCDPPTFSNNKSRGTFDIQRDHGYLIRSCMNHLSKDGTLIFSTNFTKFKMFGEIYDDFDVQDITEETIGDDFKRNSKIHRCYLIKHKVAVAKRITPRPKIVRKK